MYESNHWLKKITANNWADQQDGLPVYKDKHSGKSFVNIGDLRQKLNSKRANSRNTIIAADTEYSIQ